VTIDRNRPPGRALGAATVEPGIDASTFLLPTGTVTFLLTDVEGSTAGWEAAPEAMAKAISRHYEILADAVGDAGGVRPVELVRGLIAVSAPVAGAPIDGRADSGLPGSIPVLDRACRTHQWIERDGLRQEPLLGRVVPAGTDRALHAMGRAS